MIVVKKWPKYDNNTIDSAFITRRFDLCFVEKFEELTEIQGFENLFSVVQKCDEISKFLRQK